MSMIRSAEKKDLQTILAIYERARHFMAENGNPGQWKDSFPPESLVREDMESGRLFVVERKGTVCGVFVFAIGADESYDRIERGRWLSESTYGAIHRVASDGQAHGVFGEICSFCRERISHLRIDTHEDNRIMQHVIEKNGFARCGIIYVRDGSPRIGFEMAPAALAADFPCRPVCII